MNAVLPKMKAYFAEKLSCGAIKLTPGEISIRFILAKGKGMIGDIELERIFFHKKYKSMVAIIRTWP